MEIESLYIPGLKLLHPKIFRDKRGYFFESYSKREFEDKIGIINFVQDNESKSQFGVVRGLHFQKPPYAQAKLVRCIVGEVLDIALDIRKGSPTYGHHAAIILSEENHTEFFIPNGFAHGFAVLSEIAVFQYKCDNFYYPEAEGGINIMDSDLKIDLKLDNSKLIFSSKDTGHPSLKDYESPFIY